MTYDEFVRLYYSKGGYGVGKTACPKAWMEMLHQYQPALCQRITGSKLDPYYGGRFFPVDFVRTHWNKTLEELP